MYELFTLGGGTYLVDLLNAVAAITGGGAYITLAQLAGVAGLAWVLFRTAFGGSWKDNAKWMLLFVAVWGAMIVPKATVRVVDRLDPTLAPAVVANVPIGLALFASLTSQVGDGLTRLTEQAFTLPNDLQYQRHGLIFGARLAAKTTRLEITDAVFARNVRNYARQCVFHALLLGHMSADDLRESTDIWSLVTATGSPSAGASPARNGGVRDAPGRDRHRGHADRPRDRHLPGGCGAAERPVERRDRPRRYRVRQADIPRCQDRGAGARRAARGAAGRPRLPHRRSPERGRDHAPADGAERRPRRRRAMGGRGRQRGGAPGLYRSPGRGTDRLRLQGDRAAGRDLGAAAAHRLRVPLCRRLPDGGAADADARGRRDLPVLRHRAGLAAIVGPLYAVLHRISMGEAAERMQAAALMPGGDIGISLVAQAGIRAVASDVAVMSGYLSMSVPFLAAALAYGLSKATVLATSVLAVGQDAASSAAHEGTTATSRSRIPDTTRTASPPWRGARSAPRPMSTPTATTGYAPAGAAMTVTGDGTVVADAGAATSRIPAAGLRLSESLATSHETRAAEARTLSRHWSAEAGQARNAAVTDATGLIERYSHDVSTGEAFARGVTESESSQAQTLESHHEKLAEIAGISRNQAAVLTGQASVGGGWDFIVKAKADGSVMWRGQTIEQEAWNRVKEYDRQHGVTETWSQVSEASRRYSTQTGDSEMAGLDESLSANLTRMRTFQERASLARQESESWSEQAAQVRADAQAIERELGQPFFAWLSEQPGTDGRAIGAAGAMRIASPQTAEDSEQLREYAAAFVAEKFPAPAGPDPSTVGGVAEYEGAAGELRGAYGRETAAAYGGWSEGVRDRAGAAGAPRPGETQVGAMEERVETKTEQIMMGTAREARQTVTGQGAVEGRAGVAAETGKPFERHATENLPVVGDWLAGKLFGTAKNAVPDAPPGGTGRDRPQDERGWGDSSP